MSQALREIEGEIPGVGLVLHVTRSFALLADRCGQPVVRPLADLFADAAPPCARSSPPVGPDRGSFLSVLA